VIVGALAMAIAAFTPLDEPTNTFARVEDNTAIAGGTGGASYQGRPCGQLMHERQHEWTC
jgi:hypothetical protein